MKIKVEKRLSMGTTISLVLFTTIMGISFFFSKETLMDLGWKLIVLAIIFGVLSIHLHIDSIIEGKIEEDK